MGGGISFNPNLSDVDGTSYVSSVLTVTTTEIQAKVGAANLTGRQSLVLYNKSSVTVYYGPTGVSQTTGIPLLPNQILSMNFGEGINVFLVVATGSASVIIQEVG